MNNSKLIHDDMVRETRLNQDISKLIHDDDMGAIGIILDNVGQNILHERYIYQIIFKALDQKKDWPILLTAQMTDKVYNIENAKEIILRYNILESKLPKNIESDDDVQCYKKYIDIPYAPRAEYYKSKLEMFLN